MKSPNIRRLGDHEPVIHPTAFIDPTAVIEGQVMIGAYSSVWAGAVIRGDDGPITIGESAVVLENCLVEAPSGHAVIIGDRSILGHHSIVHGATVGNDVLIGMGAIVLDFAVIGDGVLIGAGALVRQSQQVPPAKVAFGVPARIARDISDADREYMVAEVAREARLSRLYRRLLEEEAAD